MRFPITKIIFAIGCVSFLFQTNLINNDPIEVMCNIDHVGVHNTTQVAQNILDLQLLSYDEDSNYHKNFKNNIQTISPFECDQLINIYYYANDIANNRITKQSALEKIDSYINSQCSINNNAELIVSWTNPKPYTLYSVSTYDTDIHEYSHYVQNCTNDNCTKTFNISSSMQYFIGPIQQVTCYVSSTGDCDVSFVDTRQHELITQYKYVTYSCFGLSFVIVLVSCIIRCVKIITSDKSSDKSSDNENDNNDNEKSEKFGFKDSARSPTRD